MSELELTRLLLQKLEKELNLTEEDRRVLSELKFKCIAQSIRIQGVYREKDEAVINALWDYITESLFSITGLNSLVDNRVLEEKRTPASKHCSSYSTSGPHKPVDWEYIPVKEIPKDKKKRAEFFCGNYVRLSKKKSARTLLKSEKTE